MKQTIKSTKKIALAFAALCIMGVTNHAFANSKTENPAELTYIGKLQNQPAFTLKLHNPEAATYFINIKDENNNVLYSEKISGANLSRTYRLAVNEAQLNSPDFGVTVEVTSAKTHKKEVYKISNQTKVTENIVVAKI
ncbi:MAG: hypothetical protein KGM98_15680 [Bacteroidota bacterium]|nr:hypothetical protein [Bacteroidota bacterium]